MYGSDIDGINHANDADHADDTDHADGFDNTDSFHNIDHANDAAGQACLARCQLRRYQGKHLPRVRIWQLLFPIWLVVSGNPLRCLHR